MQREMQERLGREPRALSLSRPPRVLGFGLLGFRREPLRHFQMTPQDRQRLLREGF